MQFFKIMMNDPPLVLSPDPASPIDGGLQAVTNDPNNLLQHWCLPYCPTTQNQEYGFAIMNRITGQIIQASSDNKNSAVELVDYPGAENLTNLNTWTIQESSNVGGCYFAIRPSADSDLNLNAKGSTWPSGTSIILYPWDGSKNNMSWQFSPVASYF